MEFVGDKKDEIVMKLLHYFITDQNYNPVILHGVQNEIWLEKMDGDYKIVRIVSNYIHNNEQLDFDIFKTKRIVNDIKKKTYNYKMRVLSIFLDLGDNVSLPSERNIDFVYLKKESDIKKYDFLYQYFPDIDKKLVFNEKGVSLFLKITDDINKKNKEVALNAEKIFTPKVPIITYILIGINIGVFILQKFFNFDSLFINLFALYGPYVREGQLYRLVSSCFLHADIIHIFFNMYALYVLGSQVESFFGRFKFLCIYIFSMITASLLSILLNINGVSIGASGAIFGLLGALLYFGYNFRVYLGNTLVRQIVPIIVINLLFGFMVSSIDNFAHIGGLVGGTLISMGLGIKSREGNRVNGLVLSFMYLVFLVIMNFIVFK